MDAGRARTHPLGNIADYLLPVTLKHHLPASQILFIPPGKQYRAVFNQP